MTLKKKGVTNRTLALGILMGASGGASVAFGIAEAIKGNFMLAPYLIGPGIALCVASAWWVAPE